MIPIVASNYDRFLSICEYFKIDKNTATFIDGSVISVEKPERLLISKEPDLKSGCSDWVDYRAFG